jgi:hypothetical protein
VATHYLLSGRGNNWKSEIWDIFECKMVLIVVKDYGYIQGTLELPKKSVPCSLV